MTTTRGGATIQVDDDGPGIPADRRLLVLERFSRLDDARTADTGGAGLGPAIARSVAEAHGGSIVVDAADLGGARFALHLPAPGA